MCISCRERMVVMSTQASPQQLLERYRIENLINTILDCYQIPDTTQQLTLNLRHSGFYTQRAGIQPVEIRLERTTARSQWSIRFIATFDYPNQSSKSVDVALYFNFQFQWFYQPDIKRCDLNQPEAIALLKSWLKAFVHQLTGQHFDQQHLTIAAQFS